MAHLILIRHGLSVWNELGLWTGRTDVDLHPQGVLQAKAAAELLRETRFDKVYVSGLKRAQETWRHIKETLDINPPVEISEDLNERDYGVYTGKNKWQVKEEVGEEEFMKIRRGWNHPIPGGETMEAVYRRVIPVLTNKILPELKEGKNVLVVAHGNSIRPVIKYLEGVPDEKTAELGISVGEARCYEFNENGEVCAITVKNKAGKDV